VRSHLIGKVINLIRERAEEVKVRSTVEISSDPKDDPFCLCAEHRKADFIITLNPKDFPEGRLTATIASPTSLA
jgi:predicted nucleic acid-binding protein